MFEENFTGIAVDDFILYFLAKELKLTQIIGTGIDFDTMKKELKNEIKQECYDFMVKNDILSMDFSGNTNVNEPYRTIVSSLETPDCVCIIQEIDNENDRSGQRKLCFRNGKILAFDYLDKSGSAVYEFDDREKAEAFFFGKLTIVTQNPEEAVRTIDSTQDVVNAAERCIMITEYHKTGDTYEAAQRIYVLTDDWHELQEDENGRCILAPIITQISIDAPEG